MIRIPDEIAIRIEQMADEGFEVAKNQSDWNDALWDSLMALKEEILESLSILPNQQLTTEHVEMIQPLIVRLGVIRRLELYKNGISGYPHGTPHLI